MRRRASAGATGIAILGVTILLAGCAGEPTPYVTITVQTTETVTAGPLDPIEDQIEEAVDEATAFTMPDLVGLNLQDAQDQLQDMGSFLMDQEDASGDDRWQIDDSNWKVCRQDPEPGASHSKLDIVTLWSVKNDEACPR